MYEVRLDQIVSVTMLPANEENVVLIHSFIVELGRTPAVRRLALLGKPAAGSIVRFPAGES